MTVRIAMWSGPRNLSTALMRSWESRPDTQVVDEPLYAAYLARTGLEHPGRGEILASQPTDWAEAVAGLTAPTTAAIVYQKHMAHHVPEGAELGWMAGLRHVFLLRHPAAVLASYVRRRPELVAEDLGFLQQWRLLQYVRDELGQPVVLVHSAAVLRDPASALAALCAAVEVPFDPSMLSWAPGPRPSDGVWATHWYDAVWASTGFGAPKQDLPEVPPEYQGVLAQLIPVWEALCGAG